MEMRNEIRKLARIEEGPYPFFSLYLNTRWNSEQQRERIRLFTKNQLKKGCDRLILRPPVPSAKETPGTLTWERK